MGAFGASFKVRTLSTTHATTLVPAVGPFRGDTTVGTAAGGCDQQRGLFPDAFVPSSSSSGSGP